MVNCNIIFIKFIAFSKMANMTFWNNVFFPEVALVFVALFDSLVVKSLINLPVKKIYTGRVLMHFATGKFTACILSWVTYVEYSIYEEDQKQNILIITENYLCCLFAFNLWHKSGMRSVEIYTWKPEI